MQQIRKRKAALQINLRQADDDHYRSISPYAHVYNLAVIFREMLFLITQMHLHACMEHCLFYASREGAFSRNHVPDHLSWQVWLQIGKSEMLKLHRCSLLLTYYSGLIWNLVVSGQLTWWQMHR